MSKYRQVLQMYLKHTPQSNHKVTEQLFLKAQFDQRPQKEVSPLLRYIESLEVHREYLQFFQIGVIRDQKSKIEKVAKYVGLAMPEIEPPFCSNPPNTTEPKNDKKQTKNK